ncbi:MAG TPA: DMT family transporter [Streptosporangiaceae bacterium]|nr:DMT family transporter [Streptosporangiaceae bacterium]
MRSVIAVFFGLAAAALLGLASLLERRAVKQAPVRIAFSPRLLADVARRPFFAAALVVDAAGGLLQVLALHAGSLAVVQPLLALSLLFAVVMASVIIRHRPPDRVIFIGASGTVIGMGAFLAVARPSGGSGTAGFAAAPPLGATVTAVVIGCLALARWGPRRFRPLWLALASGVDFGVNAFLLKVVPDTLPAGFGDPLRQWPLYMLVVVLPAGFLLSLNAFQADTLFAPVLAVITSADPLVSIIIGAALLHETIASAPLELAGEAIALAVMVGGIVILAHCTPHPAQEMSGTPGMARRARITSDGSAAASGRRGPAEHGSRAERPVRPRAMAAGLAREQLTAPEPGTPAAQRRGSEAA